MHATEALTEADRLMTICNSCRYCEGLCAVFPAIEMRRQFHDADLNYLANLCHGCGACYSDCQFAPPHEFNVNVPAILAKVRNDSYQTSAWPKVFQPLFVANGVAIVLLTSLSVAVFILAFVAVNAPGVIFATHTGPGAFYRLMPHNTMAVLFGLAFAYAVLAISLSARNFWRSSAMTPLSTPPFIQAAHDSATLTYLDGGGAGCSSEPNRPDRRRLYHHFTFYGFLLCFAATSIATLYHYVLGSEAPYPWYDAPVLLGTIGGLGLAIGPAGLLIEKFKRDGELRDPARLGMETAFIVLLGLTSLTGLALLAFRETSAMALLLAIHLGVVMSLFLALPYSKMMHGIYRFVALARYAQERRTHQ